MDRVELPPGVWEPRGREEGGPEEGARRVTDTTQAVIGQATPGGGDKGPDLVCGERCGPGLGLGGYGFRIQGLVSFQSGGTHLHQTSTKWTKTNSNTKSHIFTHSNRYKTWEWQ